MLGNFSSNAVVAKSRSVFGERLTQDDFLQLSTKTSVSEACSYLKQTKRFSQCLSSVNEQTIHRGQLENLLRRNTFSIYERFFKFDHTQSKAFFDSIIMKMEIDQLLTALMYINANSKDAYITILPTYLMEKCSFDLMALAKANTFDEIQTVIKNTPYFRVLKDVFARAENKNRIEINVCEQALYTYYYDNTFKSAERHFSGTAKNDIKKLLLITVDMLNILTCFRRRVYFAEDSEKIKASLIPFNFRLKGDSLDNILTSNSAADIKNTLSKIGYGTNIQPDAYNNIDLLTEKIGYDYFRHKLSLSNHAPVVYFALIEYLNVELKNVITIIEGIRYNVSPTEIQRMIVL